MSQMHLQVSKFDGVTILTCSEGCQSQTLGLFPFSLPLRGWGTLIVVNHRARFGWHPVKGVPSQTTLDWSA